MVLQELVIKRTAPLIKRWLNYTNTLRQSYWYFKSYQIFRQVTNLYPGREFCPIKSSLTVNIISDVFRAILTLKHFLFDSHFYLTFFLFTGNEINKVDGLDGLYELRELVLDKNKIKGKKHFNSVTGASKSGTLSHKLVAPKCFNYTVFVLFVPCLYAF